MPPPPHTHTHLRVARVDPGAAVHQLADCAAGLDARDGGAGWDAQLRGHGGVGRHGAHPQALQDGLEGLDAALGAPAGQGVVHDACGRAGARV